MGNSCGGEEHGLTENCVAVVLSLTSPKDVCRLSAVNSTFLSASESETVWSRFLPSDYGDIISGAVDVSELAKIRSKKDLYLYLSDNTILIDEGRKSFSLEKLTGKKCYMLRARELVDDLEGYSRTCFSSRIIFQRKSRFLVGVELEDRHRFYIRGDINIRCLSPGTNYAAYLVYNGESRLYGHATVAMEMQHDEGRVLECPNQRTDGWMEVELGEYFVNQNDNADLKFQIRDMYTTQMTGGFILQGIEIRPKYADNP